MKLTPDQLEDLREYSGLFFDPATGKMYLSDGTDTGYTFENARWAGPFGMHLTWPWLNPIGFATHATAERILSWCRSIAPRGLSAMLDESQNVLGPFYRTIERRIVVTSGERREEFAAGWLANSIIRNGETQAARSWIAELRSSRLVL